MTCSDKRSGELGHNYVPRFDDLLVQITKTGKLEKLPMFRAAELIADGRAKPAFIRVLHGPTWGPAQSEEMLSDYTGYVVVTVPGDDL